MKLQAAPRQIGGQTYQNPTAYIEDAGFTGPAAQAVINAYKSYYAAKRRGRLLAPTWLEYVSNLLGLAEELCMGVMRRYREFYGK